MNVLITGKNRSGKTTLLARLIADVSDKQGFITSEVRNEVDRIGFDLVDQTGKTVVLARTHTPTAFPVGRYFVDVAALDRYLGQSGSPTHQHQLLYLDEIGQMQLYSEKFKQLVLSYLDAPNFFIGTITNIYKDNFVEQINNRPDILTCTITPENYDEMQQGLAFALERRDVIASLGESVQQVLIHMANAYLEADQYVYFKKLFKNAVPYLAEGRIHPQEDGSYLVIGDTNQHHVMPAENGALTCDCDLFHGRGQFVGHQGLCSHLQTASLYHLSKNL